MPKLEREEQLVLCFHSFLVTVKVLVLSVSSFYDMHAYRMTIGSDNAEV